MQVLAEGFRTRIHANMSSSSLRIRRLVLFRHGACHLERGGPADKPFNLVFHRSEMNDVLKTLAVWVASGNARVHSVSFEASDDPQQALVERHLIAKVGGALDGWLESLRGRRVRVRTTADEFEGQILGIESQPSRLLLVPSTGIVQVLLLAEVSSVEALDEPSRHDLDFLLDRSRAVSAGDRRSVQIVLAGKADDLRVACVVPAAPWKLSYRLLRQADATLLIGWALVQNPAEEDLEEVEMLLSSSQPVSFMADLYGGDLSPQIIEEGVGQERVVHGTSEVSASGTILLEPPSASRPEEAFEYRVPHRISLRRGGSAMVPVVASSVAARVERVWRDERNPSPEVTLTFVNSTLSALGEGPVVIYDLGNFVGETLLPLTGRGGEVHLSYARDTAIRCHHSSRPSTIVAGVRLGAGAILEEQQREEVHHFQIESDHLEETDLVLVRPRNERRTASVEAGALLEEGTREIRLRLRVPSQGRIEASFVERWREVRRIDYERLTSSELSAWLDARLVDRSTHDALASVLSAWAQAASLEEQRGRLEREQQDAMVRHTKLREQVAVLGDEGQEGAIRLRFVKDMEREQDRIFACENELKKVRDGEAQSRRRAAQTLSVLATHAERLKP